MAPIPVTGLEIVGELDLPSAGHMALDEVLLDAVGAGRRPPILRFWGWVEPTLVLGSSQAVANELDLPAVGRRGFTVVRRLSGGGTMLAEPGRTITWSLVIPMEPIAGMSFIESFAHLDRWAVDTLRSLGVDAGYRPINDIVSPAGKIAGAAQARRRGALLHHVTMAYSMDPDLLTELVRIGRPAVSERGVRSADKKVSPLDTLVALPRAEVVAILAATSGAEPGRLEPAELEAAATLATAKYSRPEWIYRLP
ncbi:MAG: lipoate--protein ligase family protein [Candidatus Dormibacteraeota bacterium]|nr:lipoate--protein ligase family protein [Candidatus Dormibacteraeota bacterium]